MTGPFHHDRRPNDPLVVRRRRHPDRPRGGLRLREPSLHPSPRLGGADADGRCCIPDHPRPGSPLPGERNDRQPRCADHQHRLPPGADERDALAPPLRRGTPRRMERDAAGPLADPNSSDLQSQDSWWVGLRALSAQDQPQLSAHHCCGTAPFFFMASPFMALLPIMLSLRFLCSFEPSLCIMESPDIFVPCAVSMAWAAGKTRSPTTRAENASVRTLIIILAFEKEQAPGDLLVVLQWRCATALIFDAAAGPVTCADASPIGAAGPRTTD